MQSTTAEVKYKRAFKQSVLNLFSSYMIILTLHTKVNVIKIPSSDLASALYARQSAFTLFLNKSNLLLF